MKLLNNIALNWLWLIILTVTSVAIGLYFQSGDLNKVLFICVVMAIIALKGQQIIDVFMELKHAPKMWRMLLLSYVILIPLIISLIYL